MNERRPSSGSLPQAIEDAVLGILEGDDIDRDAALRALLLAHPQHAATIRHWLLAAGVPVPTSLATTRTTGGGPVSGVHGELDGELPFLLGPFLLLEMLGKGGFGTVFRAEQQEPIRRPVAVKILNPGMDSRDVLARFAAEREALNRLDHPGIARLLDAGTTPQGRPFFVMELVAGPTLVTHCRKRQLTLRQRVRLFLLVLDAMQYAHQKAMLHRDLSSNNVLVADPDGTPQPKIIDFGIAKSTTDPLLHGGALTLSGTVMGTPEFMSPEQAAGSFGDVDTRADVYALGVQLYELLTDQLPIPGVVLRAQGLAGMAEIVRSYLPIAPSAAAPRERRAELRGDLDGIVMKAIAKSRDDRYGSVGEFAADLRAHLADRPVHVASPSRWHRFRKFVRRNRTQSIAVAIAAAGVCVAFAALWSSRRIAQASADEAERLRAVSDAKADAAFNLLANEERLAAAYAAELVLLDAFLLARTELTVAQWSRLAAQPTWRDPQLPVTNVDHAQARSVLARYGLSLPTEAQWEYACRARSPWPWSAGPNVELAPACGNFRGGLQQVALLAPNAFGLFDVHGNAAEWCDDELLPYEDTVARAGDGRRERSGARVGDDVRVVRGGASHQGPIAGPLAARTTARAGQPPSTRADGLGVRPLRRVRPPSAATAQRGD